MQAQTHNDHGAEMVPNVDFDQPAQKGWAFFTKFLLWNIIATVGTLLVIGLLTVWS
ncbi:hypothetical protein [Acidocella sp.]|uniref:hypothetical protein n=1 Tax=Acidocella sp. TaxID=50710 RepID=UPI002631B3D0|nr:hypothetical protein [Acidocella sp.]